MMTLGILSLLDSHQSLLIQCARIRVQEFFGCCTVSPDAEKSALSAGESVLSAACAWQGLLPPPPPCSCPVIIYAQEQSEKHFLLHSLAHNIVLWQFARVLLAVNGAQECQSHRAAIAARSSVSTLSLSSRAAIASANFPLNVVVSRRYWQKMLQKLCSNRNACKDYYCT